MGISESSDFDRLNREYDKKPPEIIRISIEKGGLPDSLLSTTITEIIDDSESSSITSIDRTKLSSSTASGHDIDLEAPSYVGTLSTLQTYLSPSISFEVSVDDEASTRIEDSGDRVISVSYTHLTLPTIYSV